MPAITFSIDASVRTSRFLRFLALQLVMWF
jgi:hypothetical protein